MSKLNYLRCVNHAIKRQTPRLVVNVSTISTLTKPAVSHPRVNYSKVQNIRFYSSEKKLVVNVPSMAESISEGTLQTWHKNVNEQVKTDELIASIETDKIVVEVRTPESGVIVEVASQPGDTVKVGDPLFTLLVGGAAPQKSAEPKTEEKAAAKKEEPKEVKSKKETPAPQKTEPKKEKEQPLKNEEKSSPAPTPAPQKTEPKKETTTTTTPTTTTTAGASTSDSGNRTETRVPMNRMRLRIAERLKSAQNTYALLTTFQEADLKNLIELRNEFKDDFLKKHGVKLGFMSAFVKAATAALVDQPTVNAVISGNEIVYRDFVDISVAVATPRGLVVPVLRNCEKMSFADVERQIQQYGETARNGQIKMEDMAGGTFTISNGGVYGSLLGTPIINPPQSAILGMHSIIKRPVVVGPLDQVEVRPMMYLALTYDHRLIDGREAVTFLRKIKAGIEDPRRLLLGV
eukprot:TRINITY_DN9932_c0_g1_i1.p1 TRINITY_DN9932_c0_g1~~TRINITY_DN9932_c0_g1_i1.p1  ORF type:complete len:468 (-),score=130.15 TRINITY_DN9932_c0_g1_i1:41-1423(-)